MNTRKFRGFTIIEVMLFFAVSGILAVLLLAGWTVLINTQRYRDSVSSVQSFLQQQYNLVYNVENGRSSDISCEDSDVDESTGASRGQTNCVVMGRYVRITDGTQMNVYAIVGTHIVEDTATTDIDAINSRDPKMVPEDINLGLTDDDFLVPWGATIVNDSGGSDAQNIAIAIVRSPTTGTVHTFTDFLPNNVAMPAVEGELVQAANENSDVQLCLDSGARMTGGRMGVMIRAYASGPSAIEIISDKDDTCD